MTKQRRNAPETSRSDNYVRGGKRRKDEVGRSGIYPASSPDAPGDSEVRTEGGLARQRGPQRKRSDEEGSKKGDHINSRRWGGAGYESGTRSCSSRSHTSPSASRGAKAKNDRAPSQGTETTIGPFGVARPPRRSV